MNTISVVLETKSATKAVDGSMKRGRDYIIYVNESFDVKNRNDRRDLVSELNFQLKKDRLDPIDFNDRAVEKELFRLQVGRATQVKLG